MAEDVVDLVSTRIAGLPEPARHALSLAACMGSVFDETVVAVAAGIPDTVAVLRPALDAGLLQRLPRRVMPSGATRAMRFVHDRVQEAARALVPPAEFPALHLRIARAVLAVPGATDHDERLFLVASHLQAGASALADPSERLLAAEIFEAAASRGLRSGAADFALSAALSGLDYLPSDAWTAHQGLALDLHVAAASAAYRTGHAPLADDLARRVVENTHDVLDHARVHRVRIARPTDELRLREALDEGVELLRLLGVPVDRAAAPPSVATAIAGADRARAGRAPEELDALDTVAHPVWAAAQEVLCELIPAASISEPPLALLLSMAGMELVFRHGIGPSAPGICGSYAHHLCVMGNIDDGYRFGELAMRLFRRFPDDPTGVVVLVQFPVFILHHRRPVREAVALLEEGRVSP